MKIADLPACVQKAISALSDTDPDAAIEFCRWLVVDVCGEVWRDDPADVSQEEA